MVEVRRRQHETVGAMLRRFTRRVQQSGVLIHTRKNKSFKSKLTRRAVRERALRRVAMAKERARLDKLGKLPESER
ncbi:MAG: hypothetical protein HY006_02190 [Candidatus Sungbacteria bacterium]|nr:hypothetical protein [Candidatus Sungbacteria bacterium]